MDRSRRKELKQQYAEQKTLMGVVLIRNTANEKIFIVGYPNLKNKWLSIKGQLEMGRFMNLELQADWKKYGEENFTYEILEEKETEGMVDVPFEAKTMKKAWLEKLQPFEEKGYNKRNELEK